MSQRFRVEDILRQDQRGAVFLAWDVLHAEQVLLHRFFPNGSEGGGFDEETQRIYLESVGDWKTLPLPHVRGIIDGGCDEIDDIPYLVTQPITGTALTPGSLSHEQAVLFLENGLSLLSDLQAVSQSEVDWLDADIASVEWQAAGQHFRWGFDPLKWLGLQGSHNAVAVLARQLEELCPSLCTETHPLALRLHQWLSSAQQEQWNLAQAHVAWHGQAPNPASASPQRSVRHVMPSRIPQARRVTSQAPIAPPRVIQSAPRRSYTWWILGACCGLLGGLFYWGQRQPLFGHNPTAPVATNPTTGSAHAPGSLSERETLIAQLTATTPSHRPTPTESEAATPVFAPPVSDTAPVASSATPAAETTNARPIAAADTAAEPAPTQPTGPPVLVRFDQEKELRANLGKLVEVTGVISSVTTSTTGKSHYLNFAPQNKQALRGRYLLKHEIKEFDLYALQRFQGKTVTLRGFLEEEFGSKRVILDLNNANQIIEVH